MTTLAERFELLFKERPDAKPADLARSCGVAHPSVHGWLSGKTNKLEASNAIRAAAFFGVHTWWLATGEGPMRIEPGGRDVHQPEAVAAPPWPFSAPYLEYGRLPDADKRALDRVVSGFIAGRSANS